MTLTQKEVFGKIKEFKGDRPSWDNFQLRFETAVRRSIKNGKHLLNSNFVIEQKVSKEQLDKAKADNNIVILSESEYEDVSADVWAQLLNLISDPVLNRFKSKVTQDDGIKAFLYLKDYYNSKKIHNQLASFIDILNTRQKDDQAVADYATIVENKFSNLASIGWELGAKIKLAIMIWNLHKKYDNQIDNIIYQQNITVSDVIQQLSANEQRKQLRDDTDNSDSTHTGTSYKAAKDQKSCDICDAIGYHKFMHTHTKEECRYNPKNKKSNINFFPKQSKGPNNNANKSSNVSHESVSFFANTLPPAQPSANKISKSEKKVKVAIDSGADDYYFSDAINIKPLDTPVKVALANGQSMPVKHTGTCGRFKKVKYSSDIPTNLASLGKMMDTKKISVFDNETGKIYNRGDVKIVEIKPPVAIAHRENHLYFLEEKLVPENESIDSSNCHTQKCNMAVHDKSAWQIHQRMGHISIHNLRNLISQGCLKGISKIC